MDIRHILAHTDASSSISLQACNSNFVPPRPTRTADGPILSTRNTCILVVAHPLLKPVHPTIMETLNIESLYAIWCEHLRYLDPVHASNLRHHRMAAVRVHFVFPFVVAGLRFLFRAPPTYVPTESPTTPAISNPHVPTIPHPNLKHTTCITTTYIASCRRFHRGFDQLA